MYIQNYEDLDGACQEQAEYCGRLAEALLRPKSQMWDCANLGEPTLLSRGKMQQVFRRELLELSQKTGRPIEVADVKGEIWINIRERTPISKEMIEQFLVEKQPNWREKVRAMAKEYHGMAVPPANMTDRIKSQWRW